MREERLDGRINREGQEDKCLILKEGSWRSGNNYEKRGEKEERKKKRYNMRKYEVKIRT